MGPYAAVKGPCPTGIKQTPNTSTGKTSAKLTNRRDNIANNILLQGAVCQERHVTSRYALETMSLCYTRKAITRVGVTARN